MACRFVASRLLRVEAGLTRAGTDEMLCFYENGCLAMWMHSAGAERVVRSGRLPLVLGQPDCRRLIATDFSSSVLRAICGSAGHQALCYDTYGCDGVPGGHKLGLGFNGEHYLLLATLYALGNGERFYSPRLRRFCSTDRSGPFTSAGINGYAYCGGDPVNSIDPSGRTKIPTLQSLAARKVVSRGGPGIDLSTARNELLNNGKLVYSYSSKRLSSKTMAGLNDEVNHIADKTASYKSKAFDNYIKRLDLQNPGLANEISARAVGNVIESIANGLPSNHIFISQTLPASSRDRSIIDISFTGMTRAHEVRLHAAIGPYKNNIIQPGTPMRDMQPIPGVLESPEVRRLLKDINVIRSSHG
ncbi:RHS repeat-associated core domain-containing protein [Pseudomonas sp. FGI182]|uniref:RHS repeat-associated core domain-containing protein n=1 Tax=Pseudomonas sp. FGI182 TaxID=1259844 RepID=UPI0009DE92D2